MALKISGTTVVTDNSNGIFTTVTVPSTGFIEIPDDANTTFGTTSYRTRAMTPIQFADASWSWWQKPVALRYKTADKNITYVGYTSRNGSVGLAVTNNQTMQTNTYLIAGPELFNILDDHNSGVVYAGNGNVVVFFQGRCITTGTTINNASVNTKNMFFVVFNENSVNSSALVSNYANTIIQNTPFNIESSGDSSYYPNILVANNKFLFIGRQTANNAGAASGSNNWNFLTSDWPLPGNTISQPKGFFKSSQTWPYFAISRSSVNKDRFVYGLAWHPVASNFRERHLYYGYINRTASNVGESWDVYKPESSGVDTKVGNLTNAGWTPMQVANLELAVINKANSSGNVSTNSSTGVNGYMRVRMLDVNENRIAYGIFSNSLIVTCSATGAGNTIYQVNIANAFIRTSTTSMSIGGGSKSLTLSAVSSSNTTFIDGNPVTVRYDSSNYMKGYITSYNVTSGVLTFTTTAAYGSGTYSSWTVDATSALDNFYTSWVLRSSNTFLPNVSTIVSYNGASKIATLETPLNVAPVSTDTISLSGNNVSEYRVAYKIYSSNDLYEWFTKRLCTGGRDFTGGAPANYVSGALDAREYLGGMTFSYKANNILTICREVANTWYVEDIQIDNVNNMQENDTEIYDPETLTLFPGNTNIAYTVMSTISSADRPGFIYQRPNYEMLSEDAMIYDPTVNTRPILLTGYFNKRDFEDSISNVISSIGSDFVGNTIATSKSTLNNFNVSSYIELTTPTATFGYASGGLYSSAASPTVPGYGTSIDRFPFAADVSAADYGDLTYQMYGGGGASSTEHGYISGGQILASPGAAPYGGIQRFSFVVGISSQNIGNLTEQRRFNAGHSSSTNGFTAGGLNAPGGTAFVNTIDKYPFAAVADASDVGDLTQARSTSGGVSSSTNGYTTGGTIPAPLGTSTNVIDKFPFATNANATDVGDLTQGARRNITNNSDPSGGYGYASGGFASAPTNFNDIERFSFASDGNSSDVGDLSVAKRWGAGISSSTHGYNAGGDTGNPVAGFSFLTGTDKFPFASSASGTNVLNLSLARLGTQGHQG